MIVGYYLPAKTRKSRFVEMFDAYNSNRAAMEDVCLVVQDGEHGSVPRTDTGYLFLSARNVLKNHTIQLNPITHIADEYYQKILKRFSPQQDDLLLTCAGTIGNVAIVPKMDPFVADRGIMLIRPNPQKVCSQYLLSFLSSDDAVRQMNQESHGTALKHLFLNQVKRMRLPFPPLSLQREFSDFIAQLDKSKLTLRETVATLDRLYRAKLQEYFG